MKCLLCEAILESDFSLLCSSNYIQTLNFLKGCQIEEKQCKVCLTCFQKINFISSFRSSTSSKTFPSGSNVPDKAKVSSFLIKWQTKQSPERFKGHPKVVNFDLTKFAQGDLEPYS